jgi:hypothetical protein
MSLRNRQLSAEEETLPDQPENGPDLTAELLLERLNREYVDSVLHSDIKHFDEVLLDSDFRCTNPDGTIVDRAAFLKQTARPPQVADLAADDVEIRIFGDAAIVHARTSYVLPDGTVHFGRYTDVWIRRERSWRAVSAHVTRC